jgi:hypothetical protein
VHARPGAFLIDDVRARAGAAPDREVHLLQHEQGGVYGDAGEARRHQARHHIHWYSLLVLNLIASTHLHCSRFSTRSTS